jgi:hypothetical protein
LGVRAFCRRQGLAENLFYAWRRELTVRDGERVVAREATPAALQPANQRAAFAEVCVTATAEPRLTASTETATATIEIILCSQRRIAISPGFDPATLAAVLDMLERRAC